MKTKSTIYRDNITWVEKYLDERYFSFLCQKGDNNEKKAIKSQKNFA